MQQRRRRAARLFAAGKRTQAEIARELHVSRQSVSRWYEAWRSDEPGWVQGAGRAGRPPKLDDEQLEFVDAVLRQGARAHGFGTDLWTLPRVGTVIERVTGVRSHPGHVWKILGAMKWSLQRPAKQARERNQEARRQWVAAGGPAVKKRPASKSLDHLPGRKRRLGAAAGKKNLGTEGRDAGVGSRLQLEEAVNLRSAGLPVGREAMPVVVSNQAGQLQRRELDRFLVRPEETPARAEGHFNLGRFAGA